MKSTKELYDEYKASGKLNNGSSTFVSTKDAYEKQRFNRRFRYYAGQVGNVYNTYNSRFYNADGSLIEGYRENAGSEYNEFKKQNDWFNTEREYLSNYLANNATFLNSDAVTKANEFLEQSASGLEAMNGTYEFYSNFGNEDEYNSFKKQYDIENMTAPELEPYLNDPNGIAYTTADGANVTWKSIYDRKALEESVSGQIDVAKTDPNYQKYLSDGTNNDMIGYADFWGYHQGANKVASWRNSANYLYASSQAMQGRGIDQNFHYANQMTEDEADLYTYYLMTEGEEKADQYFESLKGVLQSRFENLLVSQWRGLAEDMPVFSSALSVVSSIGSGFEFLGDSVNYAVTGELDTNRAALMTNTIRGTVSEQVSWEIGNFDAFDFLYNTAMSEADSLTAGFTFGNLGGVALGLSAAAQGVNDAKNRGMSDSQAFWNGIASGIFEGIFESVSIGKFRALKEVPAETFKDIAKNIGKSMLVNASEETLTEIANIAYDSFLNGDFSAYETSVRQYMDTGMSEEEARTKAKNELISRVVEAAASGAVMGIGFGALGSVMSRNAMYADNYGVGVNELVSEALELDPNNKLAKKLNDKINSGKNISGREIRHLVRANEVAKSQIDENEEPVPPEAKPPVYDANNVSTFSADDTVNTDIDKNPSVDAGDAERGKIERTDVDSDTDDGEQENDVTLEDAAKKYGAQAQAMIHTYTEGQNIEKYDNAYQIAYDMGKSGVSLSYAMKSEATAYLSEKQREIAYEAGKANRRRYQDTRKYH